MAVTISSMRTGMESALKHGLQQWHPQWLIGMSIGTGRSIGIGTSIGGGIGTGMGIGIDTDIGIGIYIRIGIGIGIALPSPLPRRRRRGNVYAYAYVFICDFVFAFYRCVFLASLRVSLCLHRLVALLVSEPRGAAAALTRGTGDQVWQRA